MGGGGSRRGLVLVLAGSLAVSAVPRGTSSFARTQARASNLSSWPTWILTSPDQFRVGPPPREASRVTRKELRQIRRAQRHLSKKRRRLIRTWNVAATLPWTELALEMMLIHRPAAFPTRSARGLGLLHVAMYEAMVAAWDSRGQYRRKRPFRVDDEIDRLAAGKGSSYPDTHAAIAGAAERILAYLFPQEPAATFGHAADQATATRIWAGVSYPSDVIQGRMIGNRVANQVMAYGESDGHKGSPATILAARMCDPVDCNDPNQSNWVPTPFHYQYPPTDPTASTWTTYLLSSPDQFRPPLPYQYDSPQFCNELAEVKAANDTADASQRQLAFFWDDGPGTYSPAGHWNDIAVDVLRSRKLGTERTALIFAAMNAAIVDAFIAVWEAKYRYWTQRPVTAIRERPDICTGHNLYDPGWLPNIITPPFPAFPSGHSAESAAAARVLQYFFPDAGQEPNSLVGSHGTAGSFDRIADQVALSRMIGGIHFRADNEAGLILGRRIADLAIGWAQGSGVGPAARTRIRDAVTGFTSRGSVVVPRDGGEAGT
jgi:membrane-associated phospholipid phosphatase